MRARLFGLVLLLALSAAPAAACPLCYDAAQTSTGRASQAAIRHAILTLLVPPVGIMVGLVGFAFRYNRGAEQDPEEERSLSPAQGDHAQD